MLCVKIGIFLVLSLLFNSYVCQQYDFAAEITRQCLVPDPVGLLDCVENKVTLPYLTSWVDCTNSLGQNVKTSADIINYRCKSVWEGKGVIPEVFYIKDCVIEKTGLPAKNVSAEVLGAYKECESTPNSQQQSVKTAPLQQQQFRESSVEYGPSSFQIQAPVAPTPIPQFQMPTVKAPFVPQQPVRVQIPIQQVQPPSIVLPQSQNIPVRQPFQQTAVQPMQKQIQIKAPSPVQQVPVRTFMPVQQTQVPVVLNQAIPRPQFQAPPLNAQMIPNPAYPVHQPYSYQYFIIHPQAPIQNQPFLNKGIMSQKTAFVPQQQMMSSTQQISTSSQSAPFSYSYQINHPLKLAS